MSVEVGKHIGRYEIQSRIGVGGMGEVYRALDTELHRPVALKFLRPDVASDEKRMQRFIQEARAASALNHPNILTVYEIGQIDGTRFFASEFVDGTTLRTALASRRMKLIEVLDVAIQVASALVAAHAAGIVHRDIKPDNIMLRRDGYVKVLDFGLAKITERMSQSIDTEAATQALVNTDPGSVMGTAHYMSPEQASAKEVDARTDIWSLGCVLYEMVTGHSPFEGKTPSHLIVAILEKEPLPMSTYVEGVPDALEWIVTEALTKEREERTQTARELLKKLQRLKQRVDAEAELERSVSPDLLRSSSGGGASTSNMKQGAQSTVTAEHTTMPATVSGASGETHASSAEQIVKQISNHKKTIAIALATFVLAVGAVALAWYKFANRSQKPAEPERKMKITRLISNLSGHPSNATISPDGKYVAYVLSEGSKQSLWVRQVSQDTSLQIVPPAEETYYSATAFSPDSEIIYFGQRNSTDTLGALFQVPVLGGRPPKKILEHISSPISLSPDGKQFAFIRAYASTGENALMIANIDGSGEPKKLGSRTGGDWFDPAVAWSPDGKRIVSVLGSTTGGESHMVVEFPVEGGPEKQITKWRAWIPRLLWLKDGSGLIMSAAEKNGELRKIWFLSYPGGEVRKITNDLNEYGSTSLGVTADSSTILTLFGDWSSKIWVVAPHEDESRARKITNGKEDGRRGLAFTPDGKIVYSTRIGENIDLWIVNADGSGSKALTSDNYIELEPEVSADGRFIVFSSNRQNDVFHIWRMDIDGGNLRQLSNADDDEPTISPDGAWVVFVSWRTAKNTLWKVPIDGGEAVQISDKVLSMPRFSPDGKLLLCRYFDEEVKPSRWRSAIVSFEDGQINKLIDIPLSASNPRWSSDGREIIYIDTQADIGNIWSQPITGGAPKQLNNFTSNFIDSFDVSRDGKRFAVNRSTGSDDIVLIKDFK